MPRMILRRPPRGALPKRRPADGPNRAAARPARRETVSSIAVRATARPSFLPRIWRRRSSGPQIAYLLSDMMADVIRHGTAQRALVLNRDDIAGKTGTTNDAHDAWFNGFNGNLVASVWTGFDQDRSLGDGEQGARAALPTWIFFMRQALAGTPRYKLPAPDGIVTARISPVTGLLASADDPNAIMEKFIEGNLPKQEASENQNNQNPLNDGEKPLF